MRLEGSRVGAWLERGEVAPGLFRETLGGAVAVTLRMPHISAAEHGRRLRSAGACGDAVR